MIRNTILSIIVLLFCVVSVNAADTRTYGKGVHLSETTKVSDILENPDKYIGKPVKIEGMVLEVCSKRGCWVNVASDKPQQKIQIKVTDGEIVFPMEATGRNGVFEGVVDEVVMSKEQLIAYYEHLAEEKGQPFDPATVKEGSRYIRIVGLGAEIEQ